MLGRLYDRLAQVYKDEGKDKDAEEQFKVAQAALENAGASKRNIMAEVLEHYAELLQRTDRRADGERLLAQAKQIREENRHLHI
jgi:hypothetical protein